MYRQSEKLVKQQYLLHISSQYAELLPTNSWDRFTSLWHPSKFQRISGLSFVTAATSLSRRRLTKLCTMFGRLLQWHTIHFRGLLPQSGILSGAKFTLRPSLAFSYIDSVTARHAFAAWYKEWNYGTFAEGATHIRLGGHHVGHRPTF